MRRNPGSAQHPLPEFFRKTSGYTLIELLLVVVLLGVFASMAVPSFKSSYNTLQLQTVTSNVSSLMKYAQTRAITQGRMIQLTWDEEDRRCWLAQPTIERVTSSRGSSESREIFQRIPGRWGRTYEIPSSLHVAHSTPTVTFHPDGQMTKGNIRLCHGDACDPSSPDCRERCRVISTELQRGRINVFEADSSDEENFPSSPDENIYTPRGQ